MRTRYDRLRFRLSRLARCGAWVAMSVCASPILAAVSFPGGDRMLINSPIYWPHREKFFFFASILQADAPDKSQLWLAKFDLLSKEIELIMSTASRKICYIDRNGTFIVERDSSNGGEIWEYRLDGGSMSLADDQQASRRILMDCIRDIGPTWTALGGVDRHHGVRTKTFPNLAVRLNEEGERRWITVFDGTPEKRHEVPIDWARSFGMSLHPEQIAIEYGPDRRALLYPDLLPGERRKAWSNGALRVLTIDPTGRATWSDIPHVDGAGVDMLRMIPLADGSIIVAVDVYRSDGPHGVWRVIDNRVELLSSDSVLAPTLVVSPDGCAIAYAVGETSDRGQRIVNTSIVVRQICKE